jgi:hypothetical protein
MTALLIAVSALLLAVVASALIDPRPRRPEGADENVSSTRGELAPAI